MADANTTRYQFVKPEVGASADTWGAKLNTNLDDVDALIGAITTAGSSNAYALTTGLSLAAYVAGQSFDIKASFSNSGAVTIAVDGLATKAITKNGTTALVTGDLVSGQIYRISYDGTQFQLVGTTGTGVYQPLDPTLTALGALSWSSGNPLLQFTAADTVSLTLTPSVTTITLGAGAVGAVSVGVGAGTQGFYSTGTNIAWSVGSTLRGFVDGTKFQSQLPFWGPDGSVGTPGFAFSGDSDNGWYRIGTNNWAGAVGGSKWIDISSTLIDFSVPARSRLARSAETSGTLTAASANKVLPISAGITINDGVFTADDVLIVYNDSAASITLTQDTGMTLRLHGTTTTGNRTLVARGMASIYFLSATEAIVSGDVT